MGPVGSSWVQMGPTGFKLVEIGWNGSKYVQIHPTYLKQVQTGQSAISLYFNSTSPYSGWVDRSSCLCVCMGFCLWHFSQLWTKCQSMNLRPQSKYINILYISFCHNLIFNYFDLLLYTYFISQLLFLCVLSPIKYIFKIQIKIHTFTPRRKKTTNMYTFKIISVLWMWGWKNYILP